MTDQIEVQLLRDQRHGGPAGQAAQVATALADFVGAATATVDIAIYDFRLSDPHLITTVVGALTDAVHRGVTVRVGYDAGKPAEATAETFAVLQADPAPPGTDTWVRTHLGGAGVQLKAIQAAPHLMHSKYVVRDAGVPATAAVWTGSTNFTDDAWSRQENNIVRISGTTTAHGYAADFAQLWAAGAIAGTGKGDTTGSTASIGWDFSPADGRVIDAALAERIGKATSAIRVAAMVLTSHTALAALHAAITRGVPVTGVYDAGQMDPIVAAWRRSTNPATAAVLRDWLAVREHLSAKHSTPYSPTATHDFMHLKAMVIDDTLVTGSYNFSANAEHNAENQLHLTRASVVAEYRDFLDTVAAVYR
jgi:phosphatidylserine/phosphatidylglycerophosphate/cardiolipin synthase-like enzyme